MRKTRSSAVALLVTAGLVAAACGSDSDEANTTTAPAGSDAPAPTDAPDAPAPTDAAEPVATEPAPEAAAGGTLIVGAEQEPDCADWVGSCGGSSWGYWMMNVTTMPRAFDVTSSNEVVPSNILAGEPELVTSPSQEVTYKINPDAVWSDGTPITCADFEYTWDQVANGTDIYDQTGYNKISGVDASDPATCVVSFSDTYADWKGLFSAGYGIMPAHLLEGKDRNAEMKDGYEWSAGPWKIESWEKGVGITLVPNDGYWGEKPKLDKVIFQFVPDTAAGFQAFKSNQVSVLYPQPQLDAIEQINAGLDGAQSAVNAQTGNVEALWMNNAAFPLDSQAVRQAVAYSLDRDAIVERLFGGIGVDKAVQSFNPPLVAKYAGSDFSVYTKDLAKVDELMTGDGWAKDGDGYWAKDGQRATIPMLTTAGNKRRELTQQVLQQQLEEAGFELTIPGNLPAGDLFGQALPAGEFVMALYAQVATFPVPALSAIFTSTNIPGPENDNSGQNWTRTVIPEIDPLLAQVDAELDDAARVSASKEIDKLLAESATSLPLDPLPNILLWNDSVQGLEDNAIMGPFFSLAKVTVAG
jgi:peptide/nickel transport system substrate-binding protein